MNINVIPYTNDQCEREKKNIKLTSDQTCQIWHPNGTNFGTFYDQFEYILAPRAKMYWNWSLKLPNLSHLDAKFDIPEVNYSSQYKPLRCQIGTYLVQVGTKWDKYWIFNTSFHFFSPCNTYWNLKLKVPDLSDLLLNLDKFWL